MTVVARKAKQQKALKKTDPALEALVWEINASMHELAGLLLDRCQTIENGMRRHIVRVDRPRKLEDLEGKTFGQLLEMFRPRCSDQELNDWLESLRSCGMTSPIPSSARRSFSQKNLARATPA